MYDFFSISLLIRLLSHTKTFCFNRTQSQIIKKCAKRCALTIYTPPLFCSPQPLVHRTLGYFGVDVSAQCRSSSLDSVCCVCGRKWIWAVAQLFKVLIALAQQSLNRRPSIAIVSAVVPGHFWRIADAQKLWELKWVAAVGDTLQLSCF